MPFLSSYTIACVAVSNCRQCKLEKQLETRGLHGESFCPRPDGPASFVPNPLPHPSPISLRILSPIPTIVELSPSPQLQSCLHLHPITVELRRKSPSPQSTSPLRFLHCRLAHKNSLNLFMYKKTVKSNFKSSF